MSWFSSVLNQKKETPFRGHFLLPPTLDHHLRLKLKETFGFRPPHQSMSSTLVLLSALRDSKPTSFQDELSLQPLPPRPGFPTLAIPKHTSAATHRTHPRQNPAGEIACSPQISHTPTPYPSLGCFPLLSSTGKGLIKEGALRYK